MEEVPEVATEVGMEAVMVEATEAIAAFSLEAKAARTSGAAAAMWVQEAAVKPLAIMHIAMEQVQAMEADTVVVMEAQVLL